MSYLITRPQPEANKTRRALDALRLETHLCPLLNFEKLTYSLPKADEISGIILTSTSALRALNDEEVRDFIHLPIHCVGKYTAINARKAGFKYINFNIENSEALMQEVLKSPTQKPLLYLAGHERKPNVENAFAAHNVAFILCETYKMVPRETISAYTIKHLKAGNITHGVLFSERTAQIMLDLFTLYEVLDYSKKIKWYCLSQAIADKLIPLGFDAVWASEPSHESIMELIKIDRPLYTQCA